MTPEVAQHRIELEELCHRFRVKRLELFGSGTSGGFRAEGSDLDFLVEFEGPEAPGYSDRYFGLLESLEDLFGRPIDLVVASAISNPYFREVVDRTRELLYAA